MVAMNWVVMLPNCILLLLLLPVVVTSPLHSLETLDESSSSSSSSLRTLYTVQELKASGFGLPHPPRHGYALLVWYVKSCVDNNMRSLCGPSNGEYGFHYFNNRDQLLPQLDRHDHCAYYTLGNLNSQHFKKAADLPDEVRRYYDSHDKRTNMDRLLVKYCKNQNLIKDIYASAHYKSARTYLIGPQLISDLRKRDTSLGGHLWQWVILHSYNHNHEII